MFFLALPAFRPPLLSAGQQYWQPVAELLQAGEYAAAYNETQNLLASHPNDPLLLRIKGVCLMEAGYHDAAVAVLREALLVDRDSIACRYYLAQALAYRGSVLEAISQLEEVISMAPGSEYALRANQILPELRNTAETAATIPDELRGNLFARIGPEYDGNVPLRSDDHPDQSSTDSYRLAYSFYGEIRYPDQKIDAAPFTLGLGYSLNGSEYERDKFGEYDLLSHQGTVFVSRAGTFLDKYYNARLGGQFGFTQLGWEDYSTINGIDLNLSYAWWEHVVSTLTAAWLVKDFENDTEDPAFYSQDADEYNIGLQNYFYLFENKMILGVHYLYRDNNSEGDQTNFHSHNLTTSATFSLPWRLRLTGQVAYQQEDYPEYRPVGRLDDIWTFWVALDRPFCNDRLTLEVNFTSTTADSDQNGIDYDRKVVGLALSTNF